MSKCDTPSPPQRLCYMTYLTNLSVFASDTYCYKILKRRSLREEIITEGMFWDLYFKIILLFFILRLLIILISSM